MYVIVSPSFQRCSNTSPVLRGAISCCRRASSVWHPSEWPPGAGREVLRRPAGLAASLAALAAALSRASWRSTTALVERSTRHIDVKPDPRSASGAKPDGAQLGRVVVDEGRGHAEQDRELAGIHESEGNEAVAPEQLDGATSDGFDVLGA